MQCHKRLDTYAIKLIVWSVQSVNPILEFTKSTFETFVFTNDIVPLVVHLSAVEYHEVQIFPKSCIYSAQLVSIYLDPYS